MVPLKDGWFEHVMNCAEYTEVNFGRGQQSVDQMERHATKLASAAVRRAQKDYDPADRRYAAASGGRGGW